MSGTIFVILVVDNILEILKHIAFGWGNELLNHRVSVNTRKATFISSIFVHWSLILWFLIIIEALVTEKFNLTIILDVQFLCLTLVEYKFLV